MPPARRTRRSRRLAAGLALLAASAVLALAAACGGGGGGGSSDGNDDGSAAGNGQNGFAAYAECMNKNGVKLNLPSGGAFLRRSGRPVARPSGAPDGFPGGIRRSGGPGSGSFGRPAGVDDATWQKAQQACRSVMPSFGAGGQRNNPAFTAYRNCLGDHGVTLQGGRQDLNSADPKTAAAMKACEALRPTSRPTFRPTAVPSATT